MGFIFKELATPTTYEAVKLLMDDLHPELFAMYELACEEVGHHDRDSEYVNSPSLVDMAFTWDRAREYGHDPYELCREGWSGVNAYIHDNWDRAIQEIESSAFTRESYELL